MVIAPAGCLHRLYVFCYEVKDTVFALICILVITQDYIFSCLLFANLCIVLNER